MDEFEELGDEFPDIHSLFLYYNDLYFSGVLLGNTTVEWSSSRMTLCGGVCRYHPLSGCQIKLSEPLLKLRPVRDLKMVLLHEMIHAHNMTLRIRDPDPGGHGPPFVDLMNKINRSTAPDPQRPPGGYNITTTHSMHGEVDNYRTHWWECERCKKVIKRAMNRPPQEADCIGRAGARCDACRDPNCGYHTHLRGCGGAYIKVKEPPAKPKASKKKLPGGATQPVPQPNRKPVLPPGQQRIDGIVRGAKRGPDRPPSPAGAAGPHGPSGEAGPSKRGAVAVTGTGGGSGSGAGGGGTDRPQSRARTGPLDRLLQPRRPVPSSDNQQHREHQHRDLWPATSLGGTAGTVLPGDGRGAVPELRAIERGAVRDAATGPVVSSSDMGAALGHPVHPAGSQPSQAPRPRRGSPAAEAAAGAASTSVAVGAREATGAAAAAAAGGAGGSMAMAGTGARGGGGCEGDVRGTGRARGDAHPDAGAPAATEPEGVGGGCGGGVEGAAAEERRRRCAEAALARFGQGEPRPLRPSEESAASRMRQPVKQAGAEVQSTAGAERRGAAAGPSGEGAGAEGRGAVTDAAAPAVGGLARPGPGSAPTCPMASGGVGSSGDVRRDNTMVVRVLHAIVDDDNDVVMEEDEEQPQPEQLPPRAHALEGRRAQGGDTDPPRGKGSHQGPWETRQVPLAHGVVPRASTVVEVVDLVDDDSDME